MATLASNVLWSTARPAIYFDFSYDYRRSGQNMEYKITVSCRPLTGQSFFGFPINLEIKLDGTTKVSAYALKQASPSSWSDALTYTTGWMTVTGKLTGETILAVRIYSGSGSTRNTTFSYALPIIQWASTYTFLEGEDNLELEHGYSIITIAAQASYTHTLSYICGSDSGVVGSNIVAGQMTVWQPSMSLAGNYPNSTSVPITLKLDTYSGSTLIGSYSRTASYAVPDYIKPTISVYSLSEASGISGVDYLQNVSSITFKVTTGSAFSTIRNCDYSGAGYSYSGPQKDKWQTGVLRDVGENTFTFTVTDARGRTATETTTVNVTAYAKPRLTAQAERSDGDGAADINGAYVAVTASAEYSEVGDNAVTISAAWREKVASRFDTPKPWSESVPIEADVRTVIGNGEIDPTKSWEIQITAADNVTSVSYIATVGQASFPLVLGSDRFGIGRYPEGKGGWIDGPVHFNNHVYIDDTGDPGDYSAFHGSLDGHATSADTAEWSARCDSADMAETADHAKTADSATTAESATKATTDANGKSLSRYVWDLSISGNTLTVTEGGGQTKTLTLPSGGGGTSLPKRITLHADGMYPTIFSNSTLSGYDYTPVGGEILIAPDANAIYRYHTYSGKVARVYCYQPRRNGVTVTKKGEYMGAVMGNFTGYSSNTVPITGSDHTNLGGDNFVNNNNSLLRGSPFALVASFTMSSPWTSHDTIHNYITSNLSKFPLVSLGADGIDDMLIIVRAEIKLPTSGTTNVCSTFIDNGGAVFVGDTKRLDYWAAGCWYNQNTYFLGPQFTGDTTSRTWTVYNAEMDGGAGMNLYAKIGSIYYNLNNYIQSASGGEWVYEAPLADTSWNIAIEASSDAIKTVSGDSNLSYQTLDMYAKPGDIHIKTPSNLLSALTQTQIWRCKYARFGQDKQVWGKIF